MGISSAKVRYVKTFVATAGGLAASLAVASAGDLPDPRLTPGLGDPSVTKDVICPPGFTTVSIRNISSARKKAIYKVYNRDLDVEYQFNQ